MGAVVAVEAEGELFPKSREKNDMATSVRFLFAFA
jgi:hypothetical protein